MSELLVYINGELVPAAEAKISVFDSSFNFGDAIFEGMRVYDRRVYGLDAHIDRLYDSAKAIMLDIPMSKRQMRDELIRWLNANKVESDFHFRPIVTRGNRFPPRTHPKYLQGKPTVVFVGGPIEPGDGSGLRLITASVRRTPPESLDSKIKSVNYLNNMLAKLEAIRQGADDALMYDTQGFLAEASAANVFLVKRGRLMTPFPKSCLEGITRQAVIGIAQRIGYDTLERDITPVQLYAADEVFLTGTAAEVTPIIEVDGRSIGNGESGPITQQLADEYASFVRQEGVPIRKD